MIPAETHVTHSHTRDALLDAAESLFVEHGLEAASLRAITQRAGANLAAVNYHFGSKEGLIRAVFNRRLAPLQEERLRLLDAEEGRDGGTLEGVLRAFIAPAMQMRASAGPADVSQLIGRIFHEPNDEVRKMLFGEFVETLRRFLAALHRLLPELTHEELLWRFHFGVGAMSQTLSCGNLLERFSEGRCSMSDPEEVLDRLVLFFVAGLRSPAPIPGPPTRS
jgi:AcrR family transcriptional regulator